MNKLLLTLRQYSVLAFFLIIVLKACSTGIKAFTVENKYDKSIAEASTIFDEDSPGEVLALLDSGTIDDSDTYAKLLNELEQECFEGIEEIALLSAATSNKIKKQGLDYSILEVLEESLYTVQITDGRDFCRDVYVSSSY